MSSLPTPHHNKRVDQLSKDVDTAVELLQKAQEEFNTKVVELDKSFAEMNAERSDWEDEKIMIANTQKLDPLIYLDVGGTRYTARLETLQRYPKSMLSAMFSGRHTLKKTEHGEHFIDRDGRLFCYILQFLREPESFEIDLTGLALKELKKEALYFGLNDVMFPAPPPPPVPVAPFTLEATYSCNGNGYPCTITQTADGIYYGEYRNCGKKRIMTLCTGCNKGFFDYGNNGIDYFRLANFAVGRDFVPGQPQRSVCTAKCTE